MDERAFIVVHDYGQGAVGGVVFAESKSAVKSALGETWKVYEPGEDGAPEKPLEDYALKSSLAEPNEWLRETLFIADRQREGKTPFSFVSGEGDRLEHWIVWARSEQEVRLMHPWLKPYYNKPIEGLALELMKTRDVDRPEDFLRA